MPNYYVNTNAQNNGDHEVHESTCAWMPEAQHRLHLGTFTTCAPAVKEARRTYPLSNGCYYCSEACHTS
jgi:hypothetical protein